MPHIRTRLFLSYSHTDEEYREELLTHLKPLSGVVEVWHDQHIVPGADWKRAIDAALMTANVVVMLVSPDFLASEYCVNTELSMAIERWQRREVSIIPIIVRDCSWAQTPLASLHVLCADRPIGSILHRAHRDAEWEKVMQRMRALLPKSGLAAAAEGNQLANERRPRNTFRTDLFRTLLKDIRSVSRATKFVLLLLSLLATLGLVTLITLVSTLARTAPPVVTLVEPRSAQPPSTSLHSASATHTVPARNCSTNGDLFIAYSPDSRYNALLAPSPRRPSSVSPGALIAEVASQATPAARQDKVTSLADSYRGQWFSHSGSITGIQYYPDRIATRVDHVVLCQFTRLPSQRGLSSLCVGDRLTFVGQLYDITEDYLELFRCEPADTVQ